MEEIPQSEEKYLEKNGNHFTTELADYISDKYLNTSNHVWTSENIEISDVDLPKGSTLGDAVYLSNKLYKDFMILNTPKGTECIRYSIKLLSHYPSGTYFNEFLNLLKSEDLELDWSNF